MLGLGIDTGGTYTDAVIYNFRDNSVVCTSKSLTTKHNLSEGIINSINKLDKILFSKIELVSLSTTLATNACVENKGGKAKLVFIGVDKNVVRKVGKGYGLPPVEEMYFLEYEGKFNGEPVTFPDFDKFEREIGDYIYGVDAVGIVDIHAMNNNAVYERRAAEIIRSKVDIPIICGNELFNDLNCIKRGSSVLLNTKLIPVIREFLDAIKKSMKQFDIDAPVVLVRSDGSLMSENFTVIRPVETLLCGPCASVMGGITLGGETDSVIVDIGGTTTDVAIVRGSAPQKATDGINIGNWRTYVRGIYIDTFGFGGDSAIRYDKSHTLVISESRIMPISTLAEKYPGFVVEKLKQHLGEEKVHTHLIHEFFCLQKEIRDERLYSNDELTLYNALKNGPVIYTEAAELVGRDVYRINFNRLEEDGIIIRAGFTPTDAMCIKGDYTEYNPEAARLTAEYLSRCLGQEGADGFCEYIYDKLKQKLYVNLLRILWENSDEGNSNSKISEDLMSLFHKSWYKHEKIFMPYVKTNLSLVGIGAPIHIFLPDVAARMNTKCVVPKFAEVANAVGAILGNISVTCEVEVKPDFNASGVGCYTVYGKNENFVSREYDEAVEFARCEVLHQAEEEARKRGSAGEINISVSVLDNNVKLRGNAEFLLNTKVSATAVGRIRTL